MTANRTDLIAVVGGGPAGAMAAHTLVERGMRVVLIDAGSGPAKGLTIRAAGNTMFRWRQMANYSTDRHRSLADPRTEYHSSWTFGGLTNFWTAAVPRFAPEDFTEGGALDERYVWPVRYDDLVPYYEAAEKALVVTAGGTLANVPANVRAHTYDGARGWQEICRRAAAADHAMAPIPMAKGSPWMIALRPTEFNSYHSIVKPLVDSGMLTLLASAQVTRLNWSGSAQRVESIEYRDPSGSLHTMDVRAVVLAAGAIDSTRILLNSASADFPTGLGNSSGLVGHYLHDHPRQWWPLQLDRKVPAPPHPMYISREPFGVPAPLMASSATIGLHRPADRLRTFVRGSTDLLGVQIFGTMVPRHDHHVELDTKDPIDGKIGIALSYDSAERENMVHARARVQQIFADCGITADPVGPFHELAPGSSIHLGGTVRMHESPTLGVVDGTTRMHDVRNVMVCDLSCFTTGPEKNPTLTSMALAARGADRLADDIGSAVV
jgi:choline dehydrogenase-like flavoprotein